MKIKVTPKKYEDALVILKAQETEKAEFVFQNAAEARFSSRSFVCQIQI